MSNLKQRNVTQCAAVFSCDFAGAAVNFPMYFELLRWAQIQRRIKQRRVAPAAIEERMLRIEAAATRLAQKRTLACSRSSPMRSF
jgi:hypothetical protein